MWSEFNDCPFEEDFDLDLFPLAIDGMPPTTFLTYGFEECMVNMNLGSKHMLK